MITLNEAKAYLPPEIAPNAESKNQNILKQLLSKAREGNAEAQFLVGEVFDAVDIANSNKLLASKWYRKAAEQGHIKAQYNLGIMFLDGDGIAVDEIEARKFLLMAAKQGDTDAQYALGYSYHNHDNIKSYAWYSLAYDNGHADAHIALDELSALLTISDKNESLNLKKAYSLY